LGVLFILAASFSSSLGLFVSSVQKMASPLGAAAASALASSVGEGGVAYGPNNFGDIMGGLETHVMVSSGDDFSPMERIVLTANGNLQRIMSAYYGTSVSVEVKRCEKIEQRLYDREVDLVIGHGSEKKVFCTAVGKIQLLDDSCIEAIEGKSVGVGQLFRYLGALPVFTLLEAGKHASDGALWRRYELSCAQLKCEFVETFKPGFWELASCTAPAVAVASSSSSSCSSSSSSSSSSV